MERIYSRAGGDGGGGGGGGDGSTGGGGAAVVGREMQGRETVVPDPATSPRGRPFLRYPYCRSSIIMFVVWARATCAALTFQHY